MDVEESSSRSERTAQTDTRLDGAGGARDSDIEATSVDSQTKIGGAGSGTDTDLSALAYTALGAAIDVGA